MLLLPLLCLVASAGFEKNLGQASGEVRYLSRSRDVSVFLTDRETVFHTASGVAIRMSSAGKPLADSVAASTITSFVGPRERWREDVPVFDRIRRRDVFPGVDMMHYGAEYDYVVAPGANPRAIAMRFRGQKSLRIDETGALVFDNDLRHKRPVAYQLGASGMKVPVDAWFQLRGSDVAFGLGAYDSSRELVIDPEFEAVRFHGGSGDDELFYVFDTKAGTTTSIDYPFAFSEPKGQRDVFVEIDGRNFYFGGSGDERVTGMFPIFGGWMIAGETTSRDLPIAGLPRFNVSGAESVAVRSTYGGGETDGFLLCVQYGRRIGPLQAPATISAGYVGGSGRDRVVAVTDSVALVETDSTDLPVSGEGPFSATPTRSYALRLGYPSTHGYFGGAAPVTAAMEANGVVFAADADGILWTIETEKVVRAPQPLPVGGPVRAMRQAYEGWGIIAVSDRAIVRFDPDTLAVGGIYAIPGSARVRALHVHLNYAFVAGRTEDKDLATVGDAPQKTFGGGESDGFVAAIDLSNGELRFWTYVGGPGEDEATSISVGANTGLTRIAGTSNAAWGGATWHGGVDAFEATLRLPVPLLEYYSSDSLGKDLVMKPGLPADATVISADESRLRLSRDDAGQIQFEGLAASGSTNVRILTPGKWPAAVRIRHFEPGIELIVPDGGKLTIDSERIAAAQLVYGGGAATTFRPGVANKKFRVRLANPSLGVVGPPEEFEFAGGGTALVTVRGNPGAVGSTELIVDPPSPRHRSSIPVEAVRVLPEIAGTEPCLIARGFSLRNRAPIPFMVGEPAVLGSEIPGELLFASDLETPRLTPTLTAPANSLIRIGASLSARDRAALTYAMPGSSTPLVAGCTVVRPVSGFQDGSTLRLQLAEGPKQTRLVAIYADRQPLPIAYTLGARVTSSNPEILQVAMGPDWTATLTPKAVGSVVLRVETPGADPVDVNVAVLDGVPLPQLPAVVSIGQDLQVRVELAGTVGSPLTVESDDPSRVLVNGSAKVTLPSGRITFLIQALGDSGEVDVRVSGGGFSPGIIRVRLYPSTVGISNLNETISLRSGQTERLTLSYFALFETVATGLNFTVSPATAQELRDGATPAQVRVFTDDPTVAAVDPSSLTLRALRPGETTLRVEVVGFHSLPRINERRLVVTSDQ